VGVVLGPLLWLVALVVAAWAFNYSSAIALGFLVMVVSFLAALLILTLLRAGRGRQERRYADRG
jgi:peptidoglycan/LPS O-acetylase OafA/YrhL